MTHQEQVNALVADIQQLLHRYRIEFELSYASVVGVLELVKADIVDEAMFNSIHGDDDDDEEAMPF
jgi:hypothetical protein